MENYFSVLPVNDPEKPYIKLTSILDGKEYDCFSKKDIENSMSEIAGNKNKYENIINRKDSILSSVDNNSYFTVKMYNDLGGQNSAILNNTARFTILDSEEADGVKSKAVVFNLEDGASPNYKSIILSPVENGMYKGSFVMEKKLTPFTFSPEELEKKLKETIQLNEDAYLSNKKDGYKFNESEVDKESLKESGLRWSNLSEVQKHDLLMGKESSPVTVRGKNAEGKDIYLRGNLQLSRIGANSAEFMFKQQTQGISMRFAPILKK
jgi:hypothetical protein